jgi:hypothetical protein
MSAQIAYYDVSEGGSTVTATTVEPGRRYWDVMYDGERAILSERGMLRWLEGGAVTELESALNNRGDA